MKFLLWFLGFVLWNSTMSAGEIWIGNRNDELLGTGTLTDPFNGGRGDGSNFEPQNWFDQVMGGGNTPENSVIHLLPGTYHTHGRWGGSGYVLKNGLTVKGAGIDKTIIKLRSYYPQPAGGKNVVLATSDPSSVNTDQYSNIAVSDVTLDCNYPALTNISGETRLSLEGITIWGRENLRVERVKVINAAGKLSPFESFIIHLCTAQSTQTPATGVLISDSEVVNFHGGYCSAIGIYGKDENDSANPTVGKVSGIIQNCRVRFPSSPPLGSDFYAYNITGASGAILQNNMAWNSMRGFNNDTGWSENLVIKGNMFLRARAPWGIFLGCATNSVIENNIIEIIESNVAGITLAGTGYFNVTGASYCTVRGNVIRYSYGVNFATSSSSFSFPAQLPTNCTFENNRIDSRLGNSGLVNNNNIYWLNNTDLLGNNTLPNIATWQTSTVKANR